MPNAALCFFAAVHKSIRRSFTVHHAGTLDFFVCRIGDSPFVDELLVRNIGMGEKF